MKEDNSATGVGNHHSQTGIAPPQPGPPDQLAPRQAPVAPGVEDISTLEVRGQGPPLCGHSASTPPAILEQSQCTRRPPQVPE